MKQKWGKYRDEESSQEYWEAKCMVKVRKGGER